MKFITNLFKKKVLPPVEHSCFAKGIYKSLVEKPDEIPTPKEVVDEYNRQWIACGETVSINKEIQYAG